MKKITLLCLESDRDRTLESLSELGVMHLQHIQEPQDQSLTALREKMTRAHEAIRILDEIAKSDKNRDDHNLLIQARSIIEDSDEITRRAIELNHEKKNLADKLETLKLTRKTIEPLGDFDPTITTQLQQKGITIRLFMVPEKKAIKIPENTVLIETGRNQSGRYVAIAGQGSYDFDGVEVEMPKRKLSELDAEIKLLNTKLENVNTALLKLSFSINFLHAHMKDIGGQIMFAEAKHGMGSTGKVAYLQGFCPANRVAGILQVSSQQGWGLQINEPSPDDKVPTLIRNPAWMKPIESVFKMINITPGYKEVDVSASFLIFLSIFFAMIVGDAGYGLVFLVITWLVRMKLKSAPLEPFKLMTLFSICTIIWGVMSGCYFGLSAPGGFLKVKWLETNENIMNLCMVLGCIHLSVAHLWNAWRVINSTRAIAQFGWVAITWSMYFIARFLFDGTPFPFLLKPVGITGLLAILIFMTPPRKFKEEWINHAMLPLSLMSTFGDVLSYLRLFALGIASLEVAKAFNSMTSFNSLPAGLASALALFVGHTINIVLSALSVLVHGIRLNALEFSMHLGLEWSGFRYNPFTKKRT